MSVPNTSPQKRGSILIVPSPLSDVSTTQKAARASYLTIRRSAQVIAPNRLCFPGGGIEPNETPEEAGEREFWEEIGCRIRIQRKIWENVTPWNVHLDWFLATLTEKNPVFHPQEREVSEVFWSDFETLLASEDLLESNVEFLQKALAEEIDLRIEPDTIF